MPGGLTTNVLRSFAATPRSRKLVDRLVRGHLVLEQSCNDVRHDVLRVRLHANCDALASETNAPDSIGASPTR